MKLYKHIQGNMEEDKAKLKILSQKEFEKRILNIMRDRAPISMMDSILWYCEKNNVEIETAASLVTSQMKSVIETDAVRTKMVVSKKPKLKFKDNK